MVLTSDPRSMFDELMCWPVCRGSSPHLGSALNGGLLTHDVVFVCDPVAACDDVTFMRGSEIAPIRSA